MQEKPSRDIFAKMEKTKKIRALVFDLDGTLTLTQQLHYRSYAKVFRENGIKYTRAQDQTRYAGKGAERTFKEVFTAKGKRIGSSRIKKMSLQKRDIYMDILSKTAIKLVPGVTKFIKSALKMGFKIIIATGSREEAQEMVLQKTGLKKFFKNVLSAEDVKKPKPSPEIFLKAAKILKFKPEECLVFEDATMGIHAAKSAGMHCIGIATALTKTRLKKEGADYAFNDYNELMRTELLKNLSFRLS